MAEPPNPLNSRNYTLLFATQANVTGVSMIEFALQHQDNATAIGLARQSCFLGSLPVCPSSWQVTTYRPSIAGNTIYISLLLFLLAAQLYGGIRHKTWSFLCSMALGLVGEIIGYIGRLLLNQNPFIFNYFLTYLIALTLAPAFLTAAIYLCLSRIVALHGAHHSRLPPHLYTYIFIAADLFALILQGAGGGLAATASTHAASLTGAHVMVAGLVSQVMSMTLFIALWADFALRARRASGEALGSVRGSRGLEIALITATTLIYIRSVYRIVELAGGFDSMVANNQASFMVFEGPMVIGAVLALTLAHPGRVFGGMWKGAGYVKNGDIALDDSREQLAKGGAGGYESR